MRYFLDQTELRLSKTEMKSMCDKIMKLNISQGEKSGSKINDSERF
jgi:hypothetical protein